ncbi:MAG: 50S ribosomal protein L11 methyltransferase [Chitinispirillales bacterium]|jgi:ribosomal protein L11 methyltransferase|nr:50S ribosomal protein L11 methyltransferase [Chitinispirillales bacterium]
MYCLNCTIPENQNEIAYAVGYNHDMTGCVEEQFGGDMKLTFYFAEKGSADSAAASMAKLLSIDNCTVEYISNNQDWNAKWRESMEPAEIAAGVWVSPAWLEPPANGRKAWIKIEPKMAFGTGHHETTRLAAMGLIESADSVAGKSVLDIGTGSGVLCFVADYLGAKLTLGIEIDDTCRENLSENLRDNPPRSDGSVNFIIGALDAVRVDGGKKFDTVVMNMIAAEAVPLLSQIRSVSKNGTILVWSGILADECQEAIVAAENLDYEFIGCRSENEWWCGHFVL